MILVHRPVAYETTITDSADESPVVGQRAYYSDPGGVVKIYLAVLMLCLTSAVLVARAADYPAPQAGNFVVSV